MISSRTHALIVQAHVLCVDIEPDAVQALLQVAHTGEASCQLAVTSSQQADEDVVLTLQSAQASEASSRLDSVVDVPISQRSEAHQACRHWSLYHLHALHFMKFTASYHVLTYLQVCTCSCRLIRSSVQCRMVNV